MALTLDAIKNFGKVEVSTGYTSASTSIILSSGEGSKLPDPSGDGNFNLVWYNSTDYPDPADDPNVEIVRCTARSTDTLTIVRAQESTTATNKNTAGKTYQMVLSLTAKTMSDIESHNHDDVYYTQTELSTSGQSSVHWNNITNEPTYDNYVSFNIQANAGTQVAISSGEEINFISGDATTAVVVNQTNPTVTFNHNDTSTQASLTALTGVNVVSDIDLDTYGHVTNLATRDMTEDLQDLVGAMINVSGAQSGMGITYNDTSGKIDFDLSHTHSYDNYGGWDLYVETVFKGVIGTSENVDFVGGTGISIAHSTTNTNTLTITNTAPHVATNISWTAGTTLGPTCNSSTGSDSAIPVATASNSGVVTTTTQTFAGSKTFNSTISGSIDGNAGSATKLKMQSILDGTYYVLYGELRGDGSTTQYVTNESAFTYNQSTNTLTAGTFSGALSGNADTATTASNAITATSATNATNATNASNIFIWDDDTGDTNCPILFTANSTQGYKQVYEDSAIYIDNTNNKIVATSFQGTFYGNADTATTASYANQVNTTTTDASGTYYPTLSGTDLTASNSIYTDGNLSYNPSTNILTAGTFSGALSGNATTATTATNVTCTANNSTNETVYLTFVDGATGTQGIETDTVLTYNPSNNKITCGQLLATMSTNSPVNIGCKNSDNTGVSAISSFTLQTGSASEFSIYTGNSSCSLPLLRGNAYIMSSGGNIIFGTTFLDEVLTIESDASVRLGQLTSNGFVKTSSSDGTLSVDTNTYITSAYSHFTATNNPHSVNWVDDIRDSAVAASNIWTAEQTFQAGIALKDNDHIYVGSGNDLDIYHDGTYSFIDMGGTAAGIRSIGTTNLYFATNTTNRWYIDGTTGDLVPSSDSTYDIGTSSFRPANIYADAINVNSTSTATQTNYIATGISGSGNGVATYYGTQFVNDTNDGDFNGSVAVHIGNNASGSGSGTNLMGLQCSSNAEETGGSVTNVYGGYFDAGFGTNAYGIYARASDASSSNYAGYFDGNTHVQGNITVSGTVDGVDIANHQHKFMYSHNYTIPGDLEAGDLVGFFVPVMSGTVVKVTECRYKTLSGSATVTLKKNGTGLTGFTSMSVTTTAASTDPTDQTLADNDFLNIDIDSTSSGQDLTVSIYMEVEVTTQT